MAGCFLLHGGPADELRIAEGTGDNIMKKLLFALAMLVAGAFAFGTGSPASAAVTASSVTGMSDIVKADNTLSKTHYRRYRRHRYCWYYPYSWRCRRHYHYRRHHYRRYWW
jgi:hypothetical protein